MTELQETGKEKLVILKTKAHSFYAAIIYHYEICAK